MKFVMREAVNSKLGYINEIKVPVFESVDEFLNYNFFSDSVNKEKAVELLFQEASQQSKDYYGEDAVYYNCQKAVENQIMEDENKIKSNLMKDAKAFQGEYFAVRETRQVDAYDTIEINQGLFANEALANECQRILKEKYYKKVVVLDTHGQEINDNEKQ